VRVRKGCGKKDASGRLAAAPAIALLTARAGRARAQRARRHQPVKARSAVAPAGRNDVSPARADADLLRRLP
jgi:hypothetical protein